MKRLSPLRREETFPKKPLRDFPHKSHQLELVHMPNKSLARGLVTSTEIYSWTREEITILRAMWLMGSCLNRIEVLVAEGRKRGCWAVTVPNRLPYTICIPQFYCSDLGLCTAYKRMRKSSFISLHYLPSVSWFSCSTICLHSSSHLQAQPHNMFSTILLSHEVLEYTCPLTISNILTVKMIWNAVPHNEHETLEMWKSHPCYTPDPGQVLGVQVAVTSPYPLPFSEEIYCVFCPGHLWMKSFLSKW